MYLSIHARGRLQFCREFSSNFGKKILPKLFVDSSAFWKYDDDNDDNDDDNDDDKDNDDNDDDANDDNDTDEDGEKHSFSFYAIVVSVEEERSVVLLFRL